MQAIKEKLKMYNYRTMVRFRKKIWELIFIEFFRDVILNRRIMKILGVSRYELINYCWKPTAIYRTANYFYKKCSKAIFFEEGVNFSATPQDSKVRTFIKRLYGVSTDFLSENKIIKIYMQNKNDFPLPNNLQHKAMEYDLSKQIKHLSMSQRLEIAGIFLSDNSISKLFVNKHYQGKIGIIFTQPISEDGYVSENRKIEIYEDICNYYSTYGEIILKLHPRDNTIYNLKNVAVITEEFPSEIFMLFNIYFAFAVGLCTSAVLTVQADKRINLNQNFLLDSTYNLIPLSTRSA
jgi:hypothetical protein